MEKYNQKQKKLIGYYCNLLKKKMETKGGRKKQKKRKMFLIFLQVIKILYTYNMCKATYCQK